MTPFWLVVGGGWTLLALVVGLLASRYLRNRDADRKPPHVEPGPVPRKQPQRWPLRRGHQK